MLTGCCLRRLDLVRRVRLAHNERCAGLLGQIDREKEPAAERKRSGISPPTLLDIIEMLGFESSPQPTVLASSAPGHRSLTSSIPSTHLVDVVGQLLALQACACEVEVGYAEQRTHDFESHARVVVE